MDFIPTMGDIGHQTSLRKTEIWSKDPTLPLLRTVGYALSIQTFFGSNVPL